MEPASIASALIGAKMAQTQLAVATKMMRMNATAEASIAQLIDAASQNANRLANVAAGIGRNLDMSV